MATYSKVILSGQATSFPTLVTTPTLSPTAGSVANVQAPVGTAITATITAATGASGTITYTATNTFTAGQIVSVTGLGTASGTSLNIANMIIASATSSQFTVTNATVGTSSGTGTATVASPIAPVTVTAASGSGTVITYTATNTFVPGQIVTVTGLTTTTGATLNIAGMIIATASSTQFTVNNTTVGTAAATQTGTATILANTAATVNTAALTANTSSILYTTSAAHGFIVGQTITITGLSGTNNALANLANVTIVTVPSTTTFTVSVPFSTSAIALTSQSGTATSYNAVYSYVYSTNAQIFAATQLIGVSGLTTTGYNIGSSPILSVATLAAPTASTYAFSFTVSVPSTLTTTLSAQTGTASALPAIGTFIHNNTGGGLDEVWLYATNLTNSAVVLSLIVGGPQTFGAASTFPQALATPSQEMTITIPGNSGLTLINPGLILSPNTSTNYSAIYAYASQANAIAISGYVNRII
jgi:hypothetical protein